MLGEVTTDNLMEYLLQILENNEIANATMMERRMSVAKRRWAC